MNHWAITDNNGLTRFSLLVLAGLLAPCACGQQPDGDPILGLQAEVRVEQVLLAPGDPIRARFMLHNATNQTIEIPISAPNGQTEVTLPPELIFGSADEPALYVSLSRERPTAVRSPEGFDRPSQQSTVRLGPSASLGLVVDLQGSDRRFRYSGEFELEWRPFGGRIGGATAAFRVEARKQAILVTDYGKVTFSLMYDRAPRNVGNLLELVRDRFYEGTTLHRIVPGFILQGGSPSGASDGIRPDGKTVEAEFHDAPFQLGSLAMALRGQDENSASCQFFVSLARLEDLDGNYTIVGQAVGPESLRTLQKIAELPTDEDHRPLRPVVIRFFTLIDEPFAESDRVEIDAP